MPALIAGAVVGGGMLPKLEACGNALKKGVGRVRILPAAQAEILPQFYFQKLEYGTEVHRRMSLTSVMRDEQKLLLPTYDRQKVLFTRGRGVYLWDSKGKRYLDFLSGIGVNALGHGHPAIQRVLKQQAGKLIHTSNFFFHEYQAELAKRLTKISGLDSAFFCNSGTEAWEGALKLARAYARANNNNGHKAKWRMLALENSFHGRTFGSLATTGQEKYRHPFTPLVPGVNFVGFNDR